MYAHHVVYWHFLVRADVWKLTITWESQKNSFQLDKVTMLFTRLAENVSWKQFFLECTRKYVTLYTPIFFIWVEQQFTHCIFSALHTFHNDLKNLLNPLTSPWFGGRLTIFNNVAPWGSYMVRTKSCAGKLELSSTGWGTRMWFHFAESDMQDLITQIHMSSVSALFIIMESCSSWWFSFNFREEMAEVCEWRDSPLQPHSELPNHTKELRDIGCICSNKTIFQGTTCRVMFESISQTT